MKCQLYGFTHCTTERNSNSFQLFLFYLIGQGEIFLVFSNFINMFFIFFGLLFFINLKYFLLGCCQLQANPASAASAPLMLLMPVCQWRQSQMKYEPRDLAGNMLAEQL